METYFPCSSPYVWYGFNSNATYSNCDTTLSLFVVMGSIFFQPHSHCDTTFPTEIVKLYTTQSKSLETYFPCSVVAFVVMGSIFFNHTHTAMQLSQWKLRNSKLHNADHWKLPYWVLLPLSPCIGYGFNYNTTYSNMRYNFSYWNLRSSIPHNADHWKLLFHAGFFQLLVAICQVSTLPCRITLRLGC